MIALAWFGREKEPEARPRGGLFRGVLRAWSAFTTLVALGLLFYLTAHILIRTEGLRSMVAERLSEAAGIPLRIRAMGATAGFDLRIRGLESKGAKWECNGEPLARLDRLDLDLTWSAVFRQGAPRLDRAEGQGGRITLVARQGQWQPARLAWISEWVTQGLDLKLPLPEDAYPPEETPSAPADPPPPATAPAAPVVLRGVTMAWTAAGSTQELARVEGLDLNVTPLAVPGRTMTHYGLKVDRAQAVSGLEIRGLALEVLETGGQKIILRMEGERHPAPAAGRPSADTPADSSPSTTPTDHPDHPDGAGRS